MEPSNHPETTGRCWPSAVVIAALCVTTQLAHAQATGIELSAGTSSLIVLGALSGRASAALEATVSGPVANTVTWTGGARLAVGAWSSEAFARLSAAPRFGGFLPAAGVELGLSARADDDSGERLLSEGRAASREGLSPVYIALHTSPLRFQVFEHYRLSVLELQVGTHLTPFGRFVRLHVGLVSLGVVL